MSEIVLVMVVTAERALDANTFGPAAFRCLRSEPFLQFEWKKKIDKVEVKLNNLHPA
jgi:hypothetical protein